MMPEGNIHNKLTVIQKILYVIVYAWVYSFNSLSAFALGETLFFNQLSKKQGLSQVSAIDMLQSKDGYIWIGTQDGLNRFDGYQFKVFKHNNKDPKSISDNYIWSLVEDEQGYIWIGTRAGGLNRFDPRSETFISYKHSSADTTSISSNKILEVFIDSKKRLWVGTADAGLNLFNPKTGQFKRYRHEASDPSSLNANAIKVIKEASSGQLWLGYSHAPLLRYPSGGFSLFSPDTGTNKPYRMQDGLSSEHVTDFKESSDNKLWISSYGGGLDQLDLETNTFKNYTFSKNRDEEFNNRISNIVQDNIGNFWLSLMNVGVVEFNPETTQYFIHRPEKSTELSLNGPSIVNVFIQDNSLWAGTWRDGVNLAALESRQFGKLLSWSGQENALPDSRIFHIAATKGSDIWLANSLGLVRYSQQMKKKYFYPVNELIQDPNAQTMRFVFVDSQQRVWFNCDQLGLFSITLSAKNDHTVDSLTDYRKLIPDKAIVAMEELDANTFAIGTRKSGVFILNTMTNTVQHLKHTKGAKENFGLSHDAISKAGLVKEPLSGGLWIATMGGGLNYWDPKSKKITQYTASQSGLSNNNITSIILHKDNQLWLGTQGGGLNKLVWVDSRTNSEVRRYESFIYHDELASGSIGTIIMSNDNELWASTTQGLSRINLNSNKVTNFNIQDGVLPSYSIGVGYKNQLGLLLFGSFAGLTFLEPNKIVKVKSHQSVLINELLISNRPAVVSSSPEISPLQDAQIQFNSNLQFHHSISTFSFLFTSLNFNKADKIQYSYRLLGFDKEWLLTSANRRTATFTNLDAGEYIFQVKSTDGYGDWQDTATEINIEILPAPWFSWWAYTIYFLTAVCSIGLLSYQRLLQLKQKLETQKAIAENARRLKFVLWGCGEELWDWNIKTGLITRSNRLSSINLPESMNRDQIFKDTKGMHPQDLSRTSLALDSYLKGDSKSYEVVYRVKGQKDKWLWLLDRGKIVETDKSGEPIRMTGMLKDISQIKSTEEQLKLIATAFENTFEGIWIADNNYRIKVINRAFSLITGFSFSEVKDKQLKLSEIHENRSGLERYIKKDVEQNNQWQGDVWEKRKDGTLYPAELNISSIRDEDDLITHFVGVFSDITQRKKDEGELRQLARYDTLTKLPNRDLFYDRVNHCIEKMQRKDSQFALFFIDIDQFKKVNDSLGHPVGDELLSLVGERIGQVLKKADTLSRFGGDEFCILIEEISSLSVASKIAKRIIDNFNRVFQIGGTSITVTPSVGIVIYPDDGNDTDTLIKNADAAMYLAKNNGRNRYEFFTQELNINAEKNLKLESELRLALIEDHFEIHYQPKVDLSSGEVVSLEALVRWNSPTRGVVSPIEFISIAEECSLIIPLSNLIMEKVCRDLAEWISNNIYDKRIAINLSVVQFRQHASLIDSVKSILAKTNVPAKHIELEITEGMVMDNVDNAIEVMQQLRELDIHISIDDFGTGYSSLSYLKKFPVNTLKIDRAFIIDLENNNRDARIVSSIINLAHGLELNVIAEGVETVNQLNILKELNCDEIQGYLFSRPLNKSKIEQLLINKTCLADIIGSK